MHCADPYTKNTHPPAHAACSRGMRLQRGDSCSDIGAVQEVEKQFDMNHCREPNFQVFGVTQSPKDNLNCAKSIAMEESLLPTTPDKEQHQPPHFKIFLLNTCNTKRYLYNSWCYHYTHTHTVAPSYEWVLQNVKNLKTSKQE